MTNGVLPNFNLACIGEPLLELNATDSTPAMRSYREGHGGDASNVAIAAARNGARVAMLTAVGDDPAGQSFFDLWRQNGIDSSAVHVDGERPTGLYFVVHEPEGHRFSYVRRHSAASAYRLNDAAAAVIGRARFVFASGISLGISAAAADAVFAAMGQAKRAGNTTAFDTNYRPRLWPKEAAAATIRRAACSADIVFPGREDVELLFGLNDTETVIDLFLSWGSKIVVLKMGADGAILATPTSRETIPPFPCTPVDATGAGDTFCGAFLARFAEGDTPSQAARYAACAGALATETYGAVAAIPTRAHIHRALGRS